MAITLHADDAEPLEYKVVTPPAHGALTGTAPNLYYQPNAGFLGADSFTFRATDAENFSNVATISIAVAEAGTPAPTPPGSAGADSARLAGADSARLAERNAAL